MVSSLGLSRLVVELSTVQDFALFIAIEGLLRFPKLIE
jgi:hypothetical protein